jgi:hypothetical protein
MLVDLETVQVVGVALQPHQEPSEGHVRGPAKKQNSQYRRAVGGK